MLIAGDVIQLPLYAASCSYLSYGCIHVYQHLFRLDQHRNRFPLQVLTALPYALWGGGLKTRDWKTREHHLYG